MSNTIQIKHGSGNPTGKLQPYELGYSDDGCLYIGTDENTATKLTDPLVTNLLTPQQANDGKTYYCLKIPGILVTTANTNRFLVSGGGNIVYSKTAENVLKEIKALPLAGGTVTGATTIDNTLTAKTLVVGSNNWGTSAPTGTGVNGQLYFVLV